VGYEKNIITNLRNINALFSKKTLHRLGNIAVKEKLYCLGLDMLDINKVTGRIIRYKDKIQEYEDKIHRLEHKGYEASRIDEYNDKIEEYENIIAWLTYLIGMARLEQGKSAEAYKDFLYVINSDHLIDEARTEALFLAGLANIELGKIDEGINNLNEFIKHNQKSIDVVYWLGIAHYRSGDLDTAKVYFDSIILEDPGFENAYLARGNLHILSGNLDLALNNFYKIIELNPKNAEAQDFVRMIGAIQRI
jgi:tetratricopeptide (TPR) repeat protein